MVSDMMTAEDLKYSILQLAMCGKLVDQRSEEGTGEGLYKKMQADKTRLIREHKIKKDKPLAEVTIEELPFEVPQNWKAVRVGEIGSWSAGATPSRSHPEYYGGNIPWLKTGDLNDGDIYEVPEFITEEGVQHSSVRLNPVGSVLMAMYGATIGKLGILQIEATTNQACCACICYEGMWNKYLFYYLLSQRKNYIAMGAGGAQPNISKDKIVNSIIALPPLAEQKRIVAKIEELMPFVEQYAAASTKLNTLNASFPEMMKKSILQEAVQGKLVPQDPNDEPASVLLKKIAEEKKRLIKEGKIKTQKPLPEITEDEIPFDIPESWEWVRIGEIFKVGTGMTPLKGNSLFYDGGTIPWITSSLTSERYIKQANSFVTQYAVENTTLTVYPAHSLIIAMYGQGKTRGQVSELLINATTNQACAVLEYYIYYPELIEYTYYYFMFNYDVLRKKAEGTSQPNLNLKKIVETIIPIPPLNEQRRIIAKTKEIINGIGHSLLND